MAWTALFTTELLALCRSWVLRGWLIALALAEFFMLTRALLRAPGRALYTEALEHIRKSDLDNAGNLRIASMVRRKLAYILSYKDVTGALAQYQECSEADERVVAADPKDRRARMDLAVVMRDAGELQEGLPDAAAATASYRRVLERLPMLDATDPVSLMRKEQMADMYLRLGRLLNGNGTRAEAREMTMQSLEMTKSIAERQGVRPDQVAEHADELLRAEPVDLRSPGVALHYAQLASSSANDRNPTYLGLVAQAQYQLGRPAEAMSTAQKALGLLAADSAGREQLQRHIAEYRAGGRKLFVGQRWLAGNPRQVEPSRSSRALALPFVL